MNTHLILGEKPQDETDSDRPLYFDKFYGFLGGETIGSERESRFTGHIPKVTVEVR